MASVCGLCGMKTEDRGRHDQKYAAKHAEIEAQREVEARPLPPPPAPLTKKESIIEKAAKWLK